MKKETKIKILKLSIILVVFVLIALAIYLPLKLSGTLDKISSAEELKNIILEAGIYSYIIFFIIQFLQVVLLPIPAFATTVAGTLVFGPLLASIISLVSVVSASIFAFFIGRRFGKKLVIWILGEEDTEKWRAKLERGKYVFFLMMLFPIFPDDILCLVVGATTTISYKFFIITNIITRPFAIFGTAYLGSGHLIPFSGWGIPVWIVLVAIGAFVFYLSIKYQPQIEDFINKLAHKLTHLFGKNKNNITTNSSLQPTTENDDIKPDTIENNDIDNEKSSTI